MPEAKSDEGDPASNRFMKEPGFSEQNERQIKTGKLACTLPNGSPSPSPRQTSVKDHPGQVIQSEINWQRSWGNRTGYQGVTRV